MSTENNVSMPYKGLACFRHSNTILMLLGLLAFAELTALSAYAQAGTSTPVMPPEVSRADLRRAPGDYW